MKKCIITTLVLVLICVTNITFASSIENGAELKTLTINKEGLNPEFNKDKLNYSLTVPGNITSLTINAQPLDENAKVNVSGNTQLKMGDNIINIDVTSSNGFDKKQYKIIVTKTNDPDASNSYLLNLIVENATLTPKFEQEIFEYNAGNVSNDITSLKILAFPQTDKIDYEIKGNEVLQEGDNIVTITVNSLDGSTKKTYSIKVHRNTIDEDKTIEKKEPEFEHITTQDNENKGFMNTKILYLLGGALFIVIIFISVKKKKNDKHKKS